MADRFEYIYIRGIELCALLKAGGLDCWYGPDVADEDTVSDMEDLNRILASLYHKNVIDWGDDNAIVGEPLRSAVEVIRKASVCILTGQQNGRSGLSYIYASGDQLVHLTSSDRDEETLKITLLSFEDWLTALEDMEFFPEIIGEVPDDLSCGSEEACSVMEMHDMKTGEILRQLHVIDTGTYGVIYVSDHEKQAVTVCDKEEYTDLLRSWTEV